jgi:dihydroxyacetone kinase-like predicted kinase
MVTTAATQGLDGTGLHDLFASAARWLDVNAAAINAINVFPVPDGDTGSNMSLTFNATVRAVEGTHAKAGAGDVAKAMARGALMGARGNSGVILSQIIRGFADGLEGVRVASPEDLARAFRSARDAGYGAVPKPVEGTIPR